MNNKKLSLFILSIALIVFPGNESTAQRKSRSDEFSEFNTIEANDCFNIILRSADEYAVDWTVSEDVSDYVEVYVVGKVLHLSFEKKSLPKEIKKKYKGKNAPKMVLDAIVYAPAISRIVLSDKATLKSEDEELHTEDFSISLSGASVLENIKVISKTVTLEQTKASKAEMDIISESLVATTSNSSSLKLNFDSGTLTLTSNGSSKIFAKGSSTATATNSKNSSSITLSGETDNIDIQSIGTSKQDISGFAARKVYTKLSGLSEVIVNPSDILSVDLKGAKLYFMNDPVIEIVKVENGTLKHYEK